MMARRIILLVALAALLGTTVTEAVTLNSRKGRKQFRYTYYTEQLQNDKLAVYDEYGFCMHRIRVYAYGEIHEHWTYYGDGVEFVFDQNDMLIRTRTFPPDDRRERFERFPGY
jgi:hypothetical protein